MSRRGENIYKRKDNRWEGRVLISDDNGKPKYHSVYAKTYAQLKTKMDMLQKTEIPQKKNIEYDFGYFTGQWLKTVKLKCKQSTYNKYSNICKCHILPCLGNINIYLFCNDNINKLLDNISSLAEKTQNDILCVVKMIYAFAERLGYKGNACMKIVSIRVPHKQMRVLSIQEQEYYQMDALQLEPSEYKIIQYPHRGMCLYKCGNERYCLCVIAPPYKAELFGKAGGR